MIKFFRKVRQNLLSQNKFNTYILYAIGEIALVVIGILIAVNINNWNESRKQKIEEINVLTGIRSDILKDTIDINMNLKGYQNLHLADSIVLNHLVQKKVKKIPLLRYMEQSIKADFILLLHNSHFEEAKLKGLSIISNEILRESISRLYEFHYKILSILDNETESYETSKFLTKELAPYFSYDATGITMTDSSYAKLLSNSNSLYVFKKGLDYRSFFIENYETTLKNALLVAESIEKELIELKNK